MGNIEDYLEKYSLSKVEIENAINEGLLSKDIYTTVTEQGSDGMYYHNYTNSPFRKKVTEIHFKSRGIKARFEDDYDLGTKFFLTDFYLIYYKPKSIKERVFKNINGVALTALLTPDDIMVIPLKDLEYIRVVFGENRQGSTSAITYEEKGDPVKGAIAGAIVGGSTGAVIGAAMNSGTKTKTFVPAGSYNDNHFNLEIKIKDSQQYVYKDFYIIKVKDNANQNYFNNLNVLAQNIIIEAKKERTDEEKKSIVAKTISEGQKSQRLLCSNMRLWII